MELLLLLGLGLGLAFLFDNNSGSDTEGQPDPEDPNVNGSNGDDDIDRLDSNANLLINAFSGNDVIIAGNGDDTIFAGLGEDVAVGSQGDDSVFLGDDNDVFFDVELAALASGQFESGDDFVRGGSGDDQVFSVSGSDTIYGDLGADELTAIDPDGGGADTVFGGFGNDLLTGDNGDVLTGGGASDIFEIEVGAAEGPVEAVTITDFKPNFDRLEIFVEENDPLATEALGVTETATDQYDVTLGAVIVAQVTVVDGQPFDLGQITLGTLTTNL